MSEILPEIKMCHTVGVFCMIYEQIAICNTSILIISIMDKWRSSISSYHFLNILSETFLIPFILHYAVTNKGP